MKQSKITLSETFFNKEDGLSLVTISTPYGHFTGHSICNYDDGDEFNELIGGTYAEIRAWIKFYKYAIKVNSAILKELNGIYCCSKKNNPIAYRIKGRMKDIEDFIEYCKLELAKAESEIIDRNNYLGKKDE